MEITNPEIVSLSLYLFHVCIYLNKICIYIYMCVCVKVVLNYFMWKKPASQKKSFAKL